MVGWGDIEWGYKMVTKTRIISPELSAVKNKCRVKKEYTCIVSYKIHQESI